MTVSIDQDLLLGFFLALVRASAWMTITPPFATRGIPVRVKVALSAGLALLLAPSLGSHPELYDLYPFLAALVYQVVIGLALGFVVSLLFTSFQAAGEMVDFFAGFSAAAAYDPFTNATSTPIGRFYQLLTMGILFAINGHLLLVRGFLASFEAAPLSGLRLDDLGRLFTRDIVTFGLAALEIAAPLLAALFLAEVVLGLLAKAAPQMNVLAFGFTLKIGLVLLLVGIALPILPEAVGSTLVRVVSNSTAVGGG